MLRHLIFAASLCLIFVSSFAHAQQRVRPPRYEERTNLFCAQGPNNQAILTDITTQKRLGAYYSSSIETCQQALRAARNGVVCTAGPKAGYAIPTLIATGEMLGGYYYTSLESCTSSTYYQKNGVICVSGTNGQSIPMEISSKKMIGAYFFSDGDSCRSAVSYHRGDIICTAGPKRGEAALYNYKTKTFLDQYYRPDLNSCLTAY